MAPDDDENNHHNKLEGDGSDSNSLRVKISGLEQKLREEREKSELLQFEAYQDVERYKRDCLGLRLSLDRLEQDCIILRERELVDRDRIKGLYEEIERKERVFKDKYLDLKDEIRDLECANVRALNEVDEWKMKYLELKESCHLGEKSKSAENAKGKEFRELEARAVKLVEESSNLLANAKGKEDAVKVDEEMPKRSEVEDSVLTPEFKRRRIFKGVVDSESESDEKDGTPIGRLIRNNELLKVAAGPQGDYTDLANHSSGCNDIGDKMKPPRKKQFPRQALGKGKDVAAEEISNERADARIPVSRAIKRQKKSSRSSRLKKKSKVLDTSCSPIARHLASADLDYKSSSRSRTNKQSKMVDLTWSQKVAGAGTRSRSRRNYNYQKGRKHPQTEKQPHALDRAEKVWSNLSPCNPSFIKSMRRSHVSSGFWLGLPTKFCKEHLPHNSHAMVLEDENGSISCATYIAERVGLSGGWRGFALDHNLEVGDVLMFELVEPSRFKVYIIRANDEGSTEESDREIATEGNGTCSTGAKALEF